MNVLIIINDAPYGTEKAYNAMRLAMKFKSENPEAVVRIFLLADSVGCAIPGQKTPSGYYNIEIMLKSAIEKGVRVKACGACMGARGLKNLDLIDGVEPSDMVGLCEWVKDSDKVISF